MQIVADLHLHSKYSRAVSKAMTLPVMAAKARIKGIDLLATGDFTHPVWFKELQAQLSEVAQGVYAVKNAEKNAARYIIGTEVACIFSQGGRGRRIHMLVFSPNMAVAEKINQALTRHGVNLASDGRPIMGLSIINLCEILFGIDESVVLIPAHVWTPWFGLLGSKSGFDNLRECCGTYAEKILAVETGLSSNPEMNWRIEEFEKRSIVSFSDAHSPDKLGRELTVFESQSDTGDFTYQGFISALKNQGQWRISYTVEFYPEEGKYHIDGHQACSVRQTPAETLAHGRQCHVCGKPLTIGVLSRVEELAAVPASELKFSTNKAGVKLYQTPSNHQKPYMMLVPLAEILAESLEKTVKTKAVQNLYQQLVNELGSELTILTQIPLGDIEKIAGQRTAEAVQKVRSGSIYINPGYDGVFGTVAIWPKSEEETTSGKSQMSLFE